jgi:hypothetical protein
LQRTVHILGLGLAALVVATVGTAHADNTSIGGNLYEGEYHAGPWLGPYTPRPWCHRERPDPPGMMLPVTIRGLSGNSVTLQMTPSEARNALLGEPSRPQPAYSC